MTEMRLFSLRNEKEKREWMEEKFIKYVQTTARSMVVRTRSDVLRECCKEKSG